MSRRLRAGLLGARQELALAAPADEGEPTSAAVAVVDPEPRRSAAEELDALVRIRRDVHRRDVSTTPLVLEGFTSAELVSYDEPDVTGGMQRTEVLVGALVDGSVISLTVKASLGDFDRQQLQAVCRSSTAATAPPGR